MSLSRYIVKRILVSIPVLVGVTMVSFGLIQMIPGDPIEFILQFTNVSPEAEKQLYDKYNLNEPIWKQYLLWLQDVIVLDFGESIISGRDVAYEISSRLDHTIALGLFSWLIGLGVGIPTGIIAAVKRGTVTDEASRIAALLGIATPNFWLGLMLILVLSVNLGIFRVIPPDAPLLSAAKLKFLILPSVTIGTASASLIMRLVRSSMLQELNKEYVRMARAKGLSERTVIFKHVLRNSLIAVVTVAAIQIAFIINGAVVIEQVFSWPGLGRLLVRAISQRDFPIIQAGVLMTGVAIVVANLLADIVYSWLDPRIRY
ncbi:ABC transporter permease [Halosolutus halophilus]|uniref:ABC transporter permease n=1 Tax=Halosolutus halophilus TaxID=1552990 RepID=UPI0022350429|nr:ABC transporter permease [Halosolutus halophilus]